MQTFQTWEKWYDAVFKVNLCAVPFLHYLMLSISFPSFQYLGLSLSLFHVDWIPYCFVRCTWKTGFDGLFIQLHICNLQFNTRQHSQFFCYIKGGIYTADENCCRKAVRFEGQRIRIRRLQMVRALEVAHCCRKYVIICCYEHCLVWTDIIVGQNEPHRVLNPFRKCHRI